MKRLSVANALTGARILCSIVLLFLPVFSPAFYAVYLAAGLSDMLDGAAARRWGTAGEFGSRLDTAADLCLAAVCFIRMLPALRLPVWLLAWVGVIAACKCCNLLHGLRVQGRLPAIHSRLNKLTGLLLFLLPLVRSAIPPRYSAAAVCLLATAAAIQEGFLLRQRPPKG